GGVTARCALAYGRRLREARGRARDPSERGRVAESRPGRPGARQRTVCSGVSAADTYAGRAVPDAGDSRDARPPEGAGRGTRTVEGRVDLQDAGQGVGHATDQHTR